MLASKQTIQKLIESGVIEGAKAESVGPVSYDLTTKAFFIDADSYSKGVESTVLKPGDSTFVASEEVISLPADYACRVLLKNSRIRQGLRLDAPLYFPGHKTRVYFRVTNVSSAEIALTKDPGLAQITFEQLDAATELTYQGTFNDEISFRGMGDYESLYEKDIKKIQKTTEDFGEIEKRIYGKVMAIMAIIAAVFTLVNVNIKLASDADVLRIVAINLATVGSFSLLAGLISLPL